MGSLFSVLVTIIALPVIADPLAIELIDHHKAQNNPLAPNNDELREDYDTIVKRLKTGDVISYDGQKFSLGKELGGDSSTRIFAISKTKAIRIGTGQIAFSKTYVESYSVLKSAGESVVKVYVEESKPEYNFSIVERLSARFTLADFISRNDDLARHHDDNPYYPRKPGQIRLAQRVDPKIVLRALEQFVRNTAHFADIGDYNNTQVIWDGGKFILVDWSSDTELFKKIKDYNSVIEHLEDRSSIAPSYLAKLKNIVRDVRSRFQPKRSCRTLLAY